MILMEMMLEVVIGVLVMEVDKVADEVTDSCKMSNLLHGPESSNQILPREKHINRDIFGA